jgi:CRP-like cAMP-binding protein
MSLPSIFVTADEAAAKRMELNHALPGDDVAEMGGIDTLKMSTLWAIIDRAAWQVESMDAFTEVFARESEWLHRVPDELTRKVAALPSDERPRVMREWSATEEMACSPPEADEAFQMIAEIAQRSIETKRPLFLYTSL